MIYRYDMRHSHFTCMYSMYIAAYEVVAVVAKLFKSLRVDAIVEPMHLFAEAAEDMNNQRPDIFLRNLRGFGRQIILVVAVTGIDGQSSTSTSDEVSERPMQVR